jgi:hypothetical protein
MTHVNCRQQIDLDREKILGKDGMIIGDGGTGSSDYLLTPVSDPQTRAERMYNFFHSSTRMIVEQTFGIWKNRFRCLLHPMRMEHWLAVLIIQTTMILHNMCQVHNEDTYMQDATDDVVLKHLQKFDHGMCPDCKRRNKLHCIHQNMSRFKPTSNSTAEEYKAQLIEEIWERHGQEDHDFM